LKKGIKFWDGADLNCEAMKWSIERAVFRLPGPEGAAGLFYMIDHLECPEDYVLKIYLKEPDATFLARLVDPLTPVMATSPVSTPADEFAKGRYAGTGPYKLVEYTPEVRAVYELLPDWKSWACDIDDLFPGEKKELCKKSIIPMPKVIEVFYADATALAAAVEKGEVDCGFRTFFPEDILRLEKNPNLQVIKGEVSLSVRYIVFTVTVPPFDNTLLRRAIAYAIDRDAIVKKVFAGLNAPLYSMVPPGMWSHIDAFPKRDLKKAVALLLAKASSGEISLPLKLTLWYTPLHYGPTEADVAAVVKANLEETGLIEVEIKSLEWGAYVKAMSRGELGFFFLGWYPDFIDPDNFLAPWLTESPKGLGTYLDVAISSEDKAYYENFLKLLGAAKKTPLIEVRTALYEEAQRMLAESAILIPLWQNTIQHTAICQKNIRNVLLDVSMNFRNWLIYKE